MKSKPAMISPSLAAAAASARTEQQARYDRLMRNLARQREGGCKTVRVRVRDLEALIAVMAGSDLALCAGGQP